MRSRSPAGGRAEAAVPTQEPAEPVRTTVRDVAHRLRERIASHTVPPGSRLREWDVAADFGVPRLSAREALDALVHLGFVERQPNRGIVVRRRELGEILELFEMREVNEGLCARLAARNAEPASWDDLIELFGGPSRRPSNARTSMTMCVTTRSFAAG